MSSSYVGLTPEAPTSSDGGQAHDNSTYNPKGKQKASDQDLSILAQQDHAELSRHFEQMQLSRQSRHRRKRSQSADLPSSAAIDTQSHDTANPPLCRSVKQGDLSRHPELTHGDPSDRIASPSNERSKTNRRTPASVRTALPSSATTGSAEQFISLLGQSATVSASISHPAQSSASAATAALPSLYKAGRGRSINRSPSRRWDRRGASASASVLGGASGASASEGEEVGDAGKGHQHASGLSPRSQPNLQAIAARRSSLLSNAESLFSSDEDDSPLLSSSDETSNGREASRNRTSSRRWSSVERDRRRGLRILLYKRSDSVDAENPTTERLTKALLQDKSPRRLSIEDDLSLDEEISEIDVSSPSSSSSSSSCDFNGQAASGDSAAIPIKERSGRSRRRRDVASSQERAPSSSTDASLFGLSYATSTPSTSVLQSSPPGFVHLKSAVTPVSTDADPLLGLTTPSIEELIQIDQVEYFPEEAIASQQVSPHNRKKKGPSKSKTSWFIGDFESEPESDEEAPTPVQHEAIDSLGSSPPTPSANSYQARLASLQSQLRIWSRGEEATPARTRQTSAGSDESDELREKDSTSLLSASWRNLSRLPNLILLPGLSARQAKGSLATSKSPPSNEGFSEQLMSGKGQDFANIFRRASSSSQAPLDKKTVEARRVVALKTGRPSSPSPGSSPSASLMGSRKSSNDSINSIASAANSSATSRQARKGRGVATPLEADRDPSAYVSGLGQPIDPDTELSSVVHLQTFRSRSRSRNTARSANARQTNHSIASDIDTARPSRMSLPKPVKSVPVQVQKVEALSSPPQKSALSPLQVVIPLEPDASVARASKGLFQDGPTPMDTVSAPTSPTYRKNGSGSSSGDEGRTMPLTPHASPQMDDGDGFRVVRRRNRQRLSGPRSSRPKVEAPVPSGFSAFALDESDEKPESESDGERTRGRHGRAGRGRDSSPPSRQCAVGLFGGGISSSALPSLASSSRSRTRGSRKDLTQSSSPIRTVRSSPDLTYAAAAVAQAAADFEDRQPLGGDAQNDVSPPRGSRGRRGAVKVVASSVGQRPLTPQPLLLPGIAEGLRRGPSYPPRADQMLDETLVPAERPSSPNVDSCVSSSSSPTVVASVSARTRSSHDIRSKSSASASGGFGSPPLHTLRFRLLSNSAHLLMLSLELDMIKKQKISAPLKPRWGKHRANDFNPLPSLVAPVATTLSRSTPHENDCSTSPNPLSKSSSSTLPIAISSRWETNTRDPGSKLRFSWSADL